LEFRLFNPINNNALFVFLLKLFSNHSVGYTLTQFFSKVIYASRKSQGYTSSLLWLYEQVGEREAV